MDIYDLSARRYRKHHLRCICIGTGVEEEAEERKIDSLRYNQQYSGVVQMCKGLDNNATSLIYQTVHGALHLYRVYTVQAWMWEGGSRITYSA